VLLNLLSNSLKFTDRNGKILINVEFKPRAQGVADAKDSVRISVTDDGIGIQDKNKD
jgi:signal transduction histidine kinase